MNFLAHAYLSFDEPKVMVGNFIGDFVRGDIEKRFEKEIAYGIILHREIDEFTDSHHAVKKAQKILKSHFGRYALVITDMYSDYFLSKYWNQYDDRSLVEFSHYVYDVLEAHRGILPNKFLHIFNYMKEQNWLACYGTIDGMKTAFTSISRRATFNSKMEFAHIILEERHEIFKSCFEEFFPDLVTFSRKRLTELKSGI
ncbi:MAG: ACP phosphodiesterase [Anditalea sp.]